VRRTALVDELKTIKLIAGCVLPVMVRRQAGHYLKVIFVSWWHLLASFAWLRLLEVGAADVARLLQERCQAGYTIVGR
jgi:hypothetical protein